MSFMSVMSFHVISCHFMSFHVSMEFSDQLSIKSAGVRGKVFNDLIDDFTKSDFKSFWDDFEIFKIILKSGDLI
jgi:hypothetical protein